MSEPASTLGVAEFYPTPSWVVHRLLECTPMTLWLPHARVHEPCVGDGAIVNACRAFFASRHWPAPPVFEFGDIRPTAFLAEHDVAPGDYLASAPRRFDISVQNPPFSLGLKFAAKAIQHCEHVFLLHRRNWLVSALRDDRAWMEAHRPCAEFIIPDRISFYDGTTDSQEYEWYYWGPAFSGLRFLPATPLEQRRQSLRAIKAQQGLFDGSER